ncbi:VWA domain-containing protein, partial [Methanoculleus sp. MH98A]|uniref:vWA domain-containing protein n=1 Tax=Methanoculleus sp. MH98A TaxID=1495314 RepID=UPI00064FAA25
VSFRITGVDDEGNSMTDEPWISNGISISKKDDAPLVAMTDKDGFATIDFHPGAFTRNMSDPQYNDTASGSATIQAEWEGMQEDTTVSFRNYPYLSVNVTVEPQVVAVNSSVNVTIQLIGDGWALQKKPIDVVLCTDRSGSMLQNTTHGGWDSSPDWVEQESIDDRMVHAMRAAKAFVSQMQSPKDWIGLVSFGQDGTANLGGYSYEYWAGNDYKEVWHNGYRDWLGRWHDGYWEWLSDSSDDNAYIAEHYKNPQFYTDPATRDLELTSNYGSVNTTIDNWLPCGGTPMREGLYRSVQMILDSPRTTNPVKAIVLLTDGAWNTGGDPEGGDGAESFPGVGTGSVIDYADDNGIKIFTIALGNEPSHDELQRYANQTGGTFYSATAGDDLTQVYADIATKLQEAASVNTTMDLAFDEVTINSTPVADVFDYEPSTEMSKYWTGNGTTIWKLEPPKDLSDDWEGDQTLSFEVGDIYLDQTWETTFRLKVLKEGNIDIFGEDSVINFNGTVGPTELHLPHTFITATHNLSESGAAAADIWLTRESLNTDDPGILVPTWGLSYTGNKSVTQKIMYQYSQDDIWWDGNWHEADTLHHPADTNVNGTYSTTLNLGEKEGWYKIRVFAQEITPDDDGASDETTWPGSVRVGASDRAYIRIS